MTTITIDDELINQVIAKSHYENAQEAVIKILSDYLQQKNELTIGDLLAMPECAEIDFNLPERNKKSTTLTKIPQHLEKKLLQAVETSMQIEGYLPTQNTQIKQQVKRLMEHNGVKVSRGLDKTVKMKDSGVEWIGEIPAHWEVKRLKELSYIQNSNVDKKSYDHENTIKLCNYVDVYKNEFINNSLPFMEATATKSEIKQFAIKKNDVFITKDSETCDDIAISALAIESLNDVICGYHLAQFRTKEKLLLGSYLFRLFQSKNYGFRFVIFAKGITRVGLGQSAIADALTPVPPIEEQKIIATYLDEKTATIDRIIETLNAKIEKLKELRKTLINDVVTGKIKVMANSTGLK